MIDKHILPELGKRRVADVEFSHIDALHRTVTKSGSPIAAKSRCRTSVEDVYLGGPAPLEDAPGQSGDGH